MSSLGQCDHPKVLDKEIVMQQGQDAKEELDTILHEALHAVAWDLSEEAISEGATDITRLLWRLGYRRTK